MKAQDGTAVQSSPGNQTGSKTVTIGLLTPSTGVFVGQGAAALEGFEYYLDTHNRKLAGYDVKVIKADEGADAAKAVEAVTKLMDVDKVDALVGFQSSLVTYGAMKPVAQRGVPTIILTAAAEGLTQKDAAPNVFRVANSSSQTTMPIADYACKKLGYKTIAVVAQDYSYGWESAGGFARVFEDSGCNVIQEIYAPLGTEDWAPFVQELNKSAAAVFTSIVGPDAIRFLQAYKDFGVKAPLIGHGGLTDEQYLPDEGDLASGYVGTLHYSPTLDTPLNKEFAAGYLKKSGKSVSQQVEFGWTAAQAIEAALEKAAPTSRDEFIKALRAVKLKTPRGNFRFDERGQVVHDMYVRDTRKVDGKWTNVVIDTIPDVSQYWKYTEAAYFTKSDYAALKGSWSKN